MHVTAALALALAAWCGTVASGAAEDGGRCTSDALDLQGKHVTASFCILDETQENAKAPIRVTLSETLVAGDARIGRNTTLAFISAESARAIDEIPLAELGIEKRLHATFLYTGGTVRLEHALLVPGAIPVK